MTLQIRGSTYRIFKPIYKFEEGMAEISGLGGSCEDRCRAMLKTGLEWLDKHPDADLKCSEDVKSLQNAIGELEYTSCMFHAVIQTMLWIQTNGWTAYVERMKQRNRDLHLPADLH